MKLQRLFCSYFAVRIKDVWYTNAFKKLFIAKKIKGDKKKMPNKHRNLKKNKKVTVCKLGQVVDFNLSIYLYLLLY